MAHYFLVIGILIILLATFSASIAVGHYIGSKQLKKSHEKKLRIVIVAESAVFGLLALLLAFTFSGAYDRFESRKMHLLVEADAFDRAYNYIDLLPTDAQPRLRQDMREYFDIYIQIFDDVPNMNLVNSALKKANVIENRIWADAVKANKETTDKTTSQIYLMSFNDMFEAAHTGYYITQIHPPQIIFILLIILAALGAFLVGYNAAETKQKWALHSICYVLLTALTIYIVLNIEYPRIGFIGLGTFDEMLMDVRENMT